MGHAYGDAAGATSTASNIIGLQVAKLLDTTPPVTVEYHEYSSTGEVMEVVLEDRVCTRCNEKWMRKLDNRMVAFMEETIRDDEPVLLDNERQVTLAQWAVKVALLFLLHMGDEKPAEARRHEMEMFYAPADNFAAVHHNGRPPTSTQVWLGARQERPTTTSRMVVSSSTLFELPKLDPASGALILNPFGYGVVMSLHKLVFVVRGVELTHPGDAMEPYADLVPASLLPIWPTRGADLEWPPPRTLTPDEIAHIAGVQSHP